MRTKRYIMIGLLTASLAGCGMGGDDTKDSDLALIKTTNPSPALLGKNTKENLELVDSIKKDISSMKELYDVAVVKGNNDTLVAYKVKHLHRFKMKKIEKRLNEMLEKKYPDENFTISSDYKIFLEAVKLNEKMKDPKYPDKKANEKLKEIIKLKNEMT
ncbi:YhcN/YlaJ family sporulation lipoprotein [Bacillus sp. S/N-304-OC-R1]|uniref:YhcN/YlaJ family sporulation lipoprotein n=1 Tax=Bacillus sp. S/N-304-OC-R1 TaxID=2758034 RepID=UPI001C8E6B70|nr:YhcN/YlaJ family sporulation lipoprotein [Bacillus sp. S/N-304-OC-R1]MBY0120998.1 YhcN/YlaJ family sporulation lipoprotein [Bacillus sp. S/N-304-OC-R1]